MAPRKIQIELDEDLVGRARDRAADSEVPDSEVIAAAVTALLGFAALDETQAESGLPEEEADKLAVDEVRAYRAARGHAA